MHNLILVFQNYVSIYFRDIVDYFPKFKERRFVDVTNDFLFDWIRNNASVFYRFRVVASYLSKVTYITYPTCIWRPVGMTRVEFSPIYFVS